MKRDFVQSLCQAALNKQEKDIFALKNFINQNNEVGAYALSSFLEIKGAHSDGMLLLLKHGAKLSVKNNFNQNVLHLLMQKADPEFIFSFYSNKDILDYLLKENTHGPDNFGKHPIHYLFSREGHPAIEKTILTYFKDEEIIALSDLKQMTPLHCAAETGVYTRVKIFLDLDKDHKVFKMLNSNGKSIADVMREKKQIDLARRLYENEFYNTPVYYNLENYLKNTKEMMSEEKEVENCKQALIKEMQRLSQTIVIPLSEIDPDMVEIIMRKLGIATHQTAKGIELPAQNILVAKLGLIHAREIYSLTPVGQIEAKLTQEIVDKLTPVLKKHRLEQAETQHSAMEMEIEDNFQEDYQEFEDEQQDNEDGYYDHYDYQGPVLAQMPEKADIDPFNKKKAKEEIQEEIDHMSLQEFVSSFQLEQGTMAGMLDEAFMDMELLDEIVGDLLKVIHLSQSQINIDMVKAILNEMNLIFTDIDITQPGFFLNILQQSLIASFEHSYEKYQTDMILARIFHGASKHPELIEFMREFNNGYKRHDTLSQQKYWILLEPFAQRTFKFMHTFSSKKMNKLTRSLSQEFDALKKSSSFIESQKKVSKLCKVFPSASCEHLYYPGVEEKTEHYYPTADCRLALSPIFKSLRKFSKKTHALLIKNKKKSAGTEKTNVVTAVLSFVLSTLSIDAERKSSQDDSLTSSEPKPNPRIFVNVPISLNYKTLLLSHDSEDGVFKDNLEFETSVAKDNQLAAEVHESKMEDLPLLEEKAKENLFKILSTFNLPPEKKKDVFDVIQSASVSKPVELDTYLKSDVQKSTELKHSERVLLHALKNPKNILKILQTLKDQFKVALEEQKCIWERYASKGNSMNLDRSVLETKFSEFVKQDPLKKTLDLTKEFDEKGIYTIHSVALIMFSFPNSVCSGCGQGIVACQNSSTTDSGFLKLLIENINRPQGGIARYFRTRGFDETKGQQNPKEFHLTTIVASEEIFPQDNQSQIIEVNPGGKLFCLDTFSKQPFINIKYEGELNKYGHFYEYLQHQQPFSLPAIPFYGPLFMSGSKTRKLISKNLKTMDETLKQDMNEHNQQVLKK